MTSFSLRSSHEQTDCSLDIHTAGFGLIRRLKPRLKKAF
jgi:hypothetical protein